MNIIREKAKELGRTPTFYEIKQRITIRKRFGSWKNAIKLAGLEPKHQYISNEEILTILKKKTEELGRRPRCKELKLYSLIYSRFGSLEKAMKLAGLENYQRWITYEEFKSVYLEWCKKNKKIPKAKEIDRIKELPSFHALYNRFNTSWKKFRKELENELGSDYIIKKPVPVPPTPVKKVQEKKYNIRKLKKILVNKKVKLNRRLLYKEIRKNKDLLTPSTLYKYLKKNNLCEIWDEIENDSN